MKQFKMNPKNTPKPAPEQRGTTTRQEIDTLTRHVTGKIVKNPDKAAKIFENWLDQKPKSKGKKSAA